jgi:hypothetical protein
MIDIEYRLILFMNGFSPYRYESYHNPHLGVVAAGMELKADQEQMSVHFIPGNLL